LTQPAHHARYRIAGVHTRIDPRDQLVRLQFELAAGYPFLDPSMAIPQPRVDDPNTRVEIRRL
jgi:hypothetical protein